MKTRVLLIEDDRIDQRAFTRKMDEKNDKFDYEIAGSVADAKQFLSKNTYDIVLIDFALGDGNAFDLFETIEDTPYVVITGENSADVAVEAMKTGAADYLVKDLQRSYLTLLPTVIDRAISDSKLNDRLRMLSHAMERVKDSVYICNKKRNIIYVNNGFLKTYGYETEDEILGKPESCLYATDETSKVDVRHRRKDGRAFDVALSTSALNDDRGVNSQTITVVHDITERKKAEAALLEAIDKFSQLLEIQQNKNESLERNYRNLKATYDHLSTSL